VAHPDVDKVAFTGSTAVGREIAAICGEQLKRTSLELGGKSAAIVLDDADAERTAAGLRFASFMNNGQACAAQTRVLAPRSRYGEVVDALQAAVGSFVVGDPLDEATEIGPLVSERQRDRVLGYVELGEREGARRVGGAAAVPETGWYVPPTLFADVDNGMRIAREEIFGPVLVVIPYDDEEHAVELANDSPYGLGGSVWTADRERGLGVARRVRTGLFGVNTFGPDPAAPFGGYKASGIGREYGRMGLDAFVEVKAVHGA
jgi:betaine-aldehyde dehydrogenase